jgi:proline racemase
VLGVGHGLIGRWLFEWRFLGRVAAETAVAGRPAIVPTITGRAWITGMTTLLLDPDDPWPLGYKIADTWPSL